jgi:outer membrane receptor protein involved in Fe transport
MFKFIQSIRFFAVTLLLLSGVVLKAQTITGSVNGTVTDSTGAIVVGAKVTAMSVETNIATTGVTNSAGVYNIRFLQVGHYTVSIESPGFAPQKFGPFTLEANQDAKVDAKLSVQGNQQQVSIQAEMAPLLNTENGMLATTLDTHAIDNIPLVGRNFVQLTMFVPGAVSTQPGGFAGNAAIGVGGQQVSVNGNREQSNNYLLDGIEINETLNNGVGYNPSPDALGQVQVISANAPAEYGNVNGGDVVALIKSGTNQFHGSAFYYLSNYHLDANTWANKHGSTIIPKASYTQPIFGGTIGGPILKDRLFFFADYEGGRFHQGGISTATVVTAKMRTGDFSELLNPAMNLKTIQLYDASTSAFTPYVGNLHVPITNPVAIYLYAHPELYPLPNQSPTALTPATNNYLGASKSRRYNDQEDAKVDWKVTQRDNLSVRYSQSSNGSTSTPVLAITFPVAPMTPIHGVAINEVHTFNNSMVNEFRAGYMRVHPLGGSPLDTTGVFGTNGNSIVGIPGGQLFSGFSLQAFSPISTTGVSTTNGGQFTGLGNSDTATTYVDNSFTYGDVFTWSKDKHTFKFGAQFIRYQQNSYYPGNDGALGSLNYNGNFTSNPSANSAGYSVADFNLDRIIYVGRGAVTGPQGQRQWRDAYFVQDDWKVTPTLTLNLGVRYEYDQPMYEVNNKQMNVDLTNSIIVLPTTPTAAQIAAFPAGTKVLGASAAGFTRALVNPYYGGVMPRIGFSYSVTPRFVVRGGYGIQNYMEGTGANRRITINPPFATPYAATGTAPTASQPGTFFKAENGFSNPATPVQNLTLNAWDPAIKPAFIGEYSLTTEYQVSNTASLKVGYVGESGQHLVNHGAANQLTQTCNLAGGPSGAACAAAVPAPYKALVGQGGTITLTNATAMMNYNALQVTFRQRAWHGLQYTVNYAYGRAMTNAIGFFGAADINGANNYNENFYNNHIEYGPTGQDVRHNVNGNLVYQLPFGRGQMFGNNMNRVLDEIVGGWRVAMTAVAYSGFPVTINNSSNNAFTNNKVQRANHLRPLHIVNRSINFWFGTDPSATSCGLVDNGICAYGSPANGTYGNAAVGSERAPGYQQYDASANKDFTVWREQKLNFRVDASNVLNLSSLNNPSNTAQSATFGQITGVRNGPRKLQLSAKYTF